MNSTVQLVPVQIGLHAESLYNWRRSSEISKYMYTPGPASFEEHLAWLERTADDKSQVCFVVEHLGRAVGFCSLTSILHLHARAEFNLYIGDPEARMQGVGAAAEFLALNHGFNHLSLHKISCEVICSNETAVRMHLRMGFVREGIYRDHAMTSDGWVDVARLSILSAEWSQSRRKLAKALGKLIEPSTSSTINKV
jgi:UDP-4-amino-4,6-dideoxy-N-acetyl-beta-L-altrosamine N-acetyltransferase